MQDGSDQPSAEEGAAVWRFLSHEDELSDAKRGLDEELLMRNLAEALTYKSIAPKDAAGGDWSGHARFQEFLKRAFPYLWRSAQVEHVGLSLMITLEGSYRSLQPLLLISHQDVVPVQPGTEGDWTHGAFEGFSDDCYVWGRGAIDMKSHLMGVLEATEYLLKRGFTPRRTLIICLGHDEENYGTGARRMAEVLRQRRIRPFMLVDEGDYTVSDLTALGAPGRCCIRVGMVEKGYADLLLTVQSAGGHSSNPFGGTSLGIMSQAISRLVEHRWPLELIGTERELLETVGPLVTEGALASLLAGGREGIQANAPQIAELLAGQRAFYPNVQTTVAPTMISGGSSAANVMPQSMRATINYRLLAGTTVADVLERAREDLRDLPVQVAVDQETSNDPSCASSAASEGFRLLKSVAARYFVEPATGQPLPLVPSIAKGASDARLYEGVCDACLRFSPFLVDPEESARGVHGTNERITRRSYVHGIRFFVRLIQEACL